MTTTRPCIGYHGVQNVNVCVGEGCFGQSCLGNDSGYYEVELRDKEAEAAESMRRIAAWAKDMKNSLGFGPTVELQTTGESALVWEYVKSKPIYKQTKKRWWHRKPKGRHTKELI